MSRIVELLFSRRLAQVAVLALMSIGFAGCSADKSTRLSQDPFSNPFASQQEATGSVPAPAVERRELPQYAKTGPRPCRRRSLHRSLTRRSVPACREEGAGSPLTLRRAIQSRQPAL